MLEVSIPQDIENKIKQISMKRKMSESSIVTNALKYYLPLIEEGLETEFKLWDALSDEALSRFENKLEEKNAAQMEFEDGLKKVHEWFTESWVDIDKSAEF